MADGAGFAAGSFAGSAVGRRVSLCSELSGLNRGAAGVGVAERVKLRQRAHAILRLLLPGALSEAKITDRLYSVDSANELFSRWIEGARTGSESDQVRAGTLLQDLQRMAGKVLAASGGRGGERWVDIPSDFFAHGGELSASHPEHAFALPVMKEAESAGRLPDGFATSIAKIVEENPIQGVSMDDIERIAPAKYAEFIDVAARTRVAYGQIPSSSSPEYSERFEVYDALSEKRNALRMEIEEIGRAEAARRKAIVAGTVADYMREVFAGSDISEERAAAWSNQQVTITPAAARRLKKAGYPPESVLRDAAEFYRLCRGRIEKVVIDSQGDRRANANSIDNHGSAGIINLGSQFDKRVLWHELGHHIEANPVAAAAAGLFIRVRSEDGKQYPLRKLTGSKFYSPREVAFKNGFFSPYVGKVYSDGKTEVFSMALESFSDPILLARRIAADPRTFEFVIGYLSSPKTEIESMHLAMRQSMREVNESAKAESDSTASEINRRESAKVRLVPASSLPDEIDPRIHSRLSSYRWKVVGYFPPVSGVYHVMVDGKARNGKTGRMVRAFMFLKVEIDSAIMTQAGTAVPISEPEIARIFLWHWRQYGVEPSYRSIASGAVNVPEE